MQQKYPVVCVFALVAALIALASADSGSNVKDCAWNTPVCGHLRVSNRCHNFENVCQLEAANNNNNKNNKAPNHTTPFAVIDDRFCVEIPLNTNGWCKGLRSRRRPGFPDDGSFNGGSNGYNAHYVSIRSY